MTSGMAKKQFYDKHQRTPWKMAQNSLQSPYPFLDQLLAEQRLSYFDYACTLNLIHGRDHLDETVALSICHLILAAKIGHLCVKVDEGLSVYPRVDHVWISNSELPLSEQDIAFLTRKVAEGLVNIPSDLIAQIDETSLSLPLTTPFCRYRNMVYLQRHWLYETQILKSIKRLTGSSPSLELDKEKVTHSVWNLSERGELLKEQADAVLKGCLSSMSLITGGPGTGKTHTVSHLIALFWENLTESQKKQCEIALAAPTGKASSHLQKSVMRMASKVENFPILTAKTLHSLLGFKKAEEEESQESYPLISADLIIVDESSMIDVRLMCRLLSSIKEGARLILIGDQHQLPAVEAGSLFADLAHLNSIPSTHLKTCLRTELAPMLQFAETINAGDSAEALKQLNSGDHSCLKRVPLPVDLDGTRSVLWENVKSHFSLPLERDLPPEVLLQNLGRFCLLSPLRKGPLGVDELNRYIAEKMRAIHPKEGWMMIPVMIVANDRRQELVNGEVGLLMKNCSAGSDPQDDYGLFYSKEEQGTRKIPAYMLPKYEYAYCLSVHKSQGSEFDHVLLIMPDGSELFGREVFYTAVTRARKQLEIAGTDAVMTKVITQSGERFSGIVQRSDEEVIKVIVRNQSMV